MATASRRSGMWSSAARRSAVVTGGMALLLTATLGISAVAASRVSRWTPAVNLSSSGGGSPDMVVSADGTTAVAVWLCKKRCHRVVV